MTVPRELSRPPSPTHIVLACLFGLLFVVGLWGFTLQWVPFLLGILGAAILTGLVGLRIILRWLVPAQRHQIQVPARKFWRRTGAFAGVLVLAALVGYAEVALGWRYTVCIPGATRIVDDALNSPATVLDVEGRCLGVPDAIAAFKVPGGVAIEIRERRHTGFEHAIWNGLARLDGPVGKEIVWRDGRYGDMRVVLKDLTRIWGRWYVWRW